MKTEVEQNTTRVKDPVGPFKPDYFFRSADGKPAEIALLVAS